VSRALNVLADRLRKKGQIARIRLTEAGVWEAVRPCRREERLRRRRRQKKQPISTT
jgi:hypothetical protein